VLHVTEAADALTIIVEAMSTDVRIAEIRFVKFFMVVTSLSSL